VPITVENLLMDRVDCLPASSRAFLEAAAVLGRSFNPELAGQISGVSKDVEGLASGLSTLDIVRQKRAGSYSFKHALLHDAVYNSLMTERCQVLHGRAAKTIEMSSQKVDKILELAHHWGRSGRADKAVPALAQAGEECLRVYSLDEADGYLQHALELAEKNPDLIDETLVVDLLLHLARIAYFRGLPTQIIEMVETHLPRVEALEDPLRLARFLFEGGYARVFHGQELEGKAWLERSLEIAEEANSDVARAYACLGMSWFYTFRPPPESDHWELSKSNAKIAFETGERVSDVWLASKALLSLSMGGSLKGCPKDAEHYAKSLLELATRTNDPRPRAMGLYAMSILAVTNNDGESAIDYADEALQSALSPVDQAAAAAFKSWGQILVGRTVDAKGTATEGYVRQIMNEYASFRIPRRVFDGLSEVLEGRLGKGVAMIKEGKKEAERHNFLPGPGIALQVLGDIYFLMLKGDEKPTLSGVISNLGFLIATLPRAEKLTRKCFEELRLLALQMDAPAFHAKALLRLGQLSAHRGKADKARSYFNDARKLASESGAAHILRELDREFHSISATA
jgi:tetratricopeptide (TPR) repeat protein